MLNQELSYHTSADCTRGRPTKPGNRGLAWPPSGNSYCHENSHIPPLRGAALHESASGIAAAPGDICLMEIAFTDGSAVKVRPALVLATQDSDLVVAPLTSKAHNRDFDVEIASWGASCVGKRSIVRCAKIESVSRTLVFAIVGSILRDDWMRVRQTAEEWFRKIVLAPLS